MTKIRTLPLTKVERLGMKSVVCTHKHPMMQHPQLASGQLLQRVRCSLDERDCATLDAPVDLEYRVERAPRGMDPAIVLHQISCRCSFGQELINLQINKQRGGVSDMCVCVCVWCETESDTVIK